MAMDATPGLVEIREKSARGLRSTDRLGPAVILTLVFVVLLALGLLNGLMLPLIILGGAGFLAMLIVLTVTRRVIKSETLDRTVEPLLPWVTGGFILGEEGLYTREFIAYRLRPWESLSLDRLDPRRGRVALRAGEMMVHLRERPGRGAAGYDELVGVVTGHLPPDRREPRHRPATRQWLTAIAVVAVCGLAAFALSAYGSIYLEDHATGQVGDGICDVCGRPLHDFLTYVLESRDGQPFHEYCQWDGTLYYTLHPIMAWSNALGPAAKSAAGGNPGGSFGDSLLLRSTAVYGLISWWLVGCIVLGVASLCLPKSVVLDR